MKCSSYDGDPDFDFSEKIAYEQLKKSLFITDPVDILFRSYYIHQESHNRSVVISSGFTIIPFFHTYRYKGSST